MRQRKWLKLLEDYDLIINYHPEKGNVVADALRRESHGNLTSMVDILKYLVRLRIEVQLYELMMLLANLKVQPSVFEA